MYIYRYVYIYIYICKYVYIDIDIYEKIPVEIVMVYSCGAETICLKLLVSQPPVFSGCSWGR